MAAIAPLTPLRYDLARTGGDLSLLVAPPYDVIDGALRAELASRHTNNIVALDLPEGEGDAKYAHAAQLMREWIASGVLVRDTRPAFYRYTQSFGPPGGGERIVRRGFLALVRVVPLDAKVVLPHERTLSGPKEDRWKLSRATRAALSPGFMLYSDPARALDKALEEATVLASFETPDGVAHELARVDEAAAVRTIVEGVARSSLLIADGHHRYETAVRYAADVRAEDRAALPDGEHEYFMAFLANGDDPELVVFPTHRHVHDVEGASYDAVVAAAVDLFSVRELPRGAAGADYVKVLSDAGARAPSFVVCAADGRAALLTLDPSADLEAHAVLGDAHPELRRTDVALLHMGILEPIVGISKEAQAAKTNIWYPQDASAAVESLRAGKGQLLFLMNGTPVSDIRRVAEAGEVMPQKSTFFYPKLATGLWINPLA